MAILKTPDEIKIMAEAGKILAEVLKTLRNEVKEGVSTNSIDRLAKRLIEEAGAKPAFLGYKPSKNAKAFPATICASINETVVHGLPNDKLLKNGDVVAIDVGVKYKGFYSDSAFTVAIGSISENTRRLLTITEEALFLGIKEAKPGNTLGDVGFAIQNHVTKNGFSIVESLTGHGIGRDLHESPNVLNVGHPKTGEEIREGMVLAIEPMVSMGKGKIKQLPDDSFKTEDNSLSAHFEHTVAITGKGPQILTKT